MVRCRENDDRKYEFQIFIATMGEKREDNVLIPFRLISVGRTNYPNITGDAIANQDIIPDDPEISQAIPVGATTSIQTSVQG
jgi:hypothetical protein